MLTGRPQQRCRSGEWQCSNGDCIHLSGRCNGRYECRDYSDEASCSKYSSKSEFCK